MAKIRFQLIDEPQKNNKVRFQLIDEPKTNTYSEPFSSNSVIATKKDKNNINIPIAKGISNNVATPIMPKTINQPIKTLTKKQTNAEGYTYTGKNYGDYWYQEYNKRKDEQIYEKDGQYYIYSKGKYQPINSLNYMIIKESDKKALNNAISSGFKQSKSNLSIEDRIKLDTSYLTDKEYKEYEKDLTRQQKNKEKQQKIKNAVHYGGTGLNALGEVKTGLSNVANNIDKEVITPIKYAKDNYETGKLNNQLALEYYKQMEGQDNIASQMANKVAKYNKFNEDLLTNPGATGTAIQNMNTQVESIKNQGIAATILAGGGAAIGGLASGGSGAVAGAKVGGAIGYTFGSTPYTYKLEAGNQYKTLIEMGVPENIAKKYSRITGGVNAAIESGENIVDLLTFGIGGKATNQVEKETINKLVDDYGESKVRNWLTKKFGENATDRIISATKTAGKSYIQNIFSEAGEEMTQEATSIAGERLASKEGGIKRNTTLQEDLGRVLEAGKEAAISTAFTAPITSLGGSIATNTVNNIQSNINDKINNKNNTQIEEEEQKTINEPINKETLQNGLQNKPVETDLNSRVTQMREQEQNMSLNDQITQMREQDLARKQVNERKRLTNQVNQIENKVDKLSDTSKTFTQDNKTIIPTRDQFVNKTNELKQEMNLPKPTTKGMTLQESATKYNIDANSEPVRLTQKLFTNRGIESRYDASMFKDNNVAGLWYKDENGNRGVILNPNASEDTIIENLAVHELTHDLMSSENSKNTLKSDDIIKYVETLDGYAEARKNLIETYSKQYDPNSNNFKSLIDEEVVADVLGKRLGNQEFINRLVNQNQSTAKKIYNWIIDKLNSLVNSGGKVRSERLYWENVKNRFEKAYNKEYNNSTNENSTRYSSIGIKQVNKTLNNSEISERQRTILSRIKANYEKAIKMDGKYTNEQIHKATGWYKDSKGNWHFEITDKYAKFNFKPEKNETYTLGELLNHKLLYDIDPTLKNVKVQFRDIKSKGKFGVLPGFRKITLNNNLINKGSQETLSTLLHEIQHKLQLDNKFENGMSSGKTLNDMIDYVNSLGEIEATDTSIRMNKTQKELINSMPELAKEKPRHAYENELIQQRKNSIAKNQKEKYNKSRWESNEENISQNKNVDFNNDTWDRLRTNNSSFSYDSQGRKLSTQQNEYFKDSKVRDNDGNLKVLYNGSGNHTTYNSAYMSEESIWGKGIYLTQFKNIAEMYGNDIKEVYVNITNPIKNGKNLTFEQYNEFYKAINDGEEAYREEYDMYDDDMDLLWDATNKGNWADYAEELKRYTGYDGIIVESEEFEDSDRMVIAFQSNQVKNIDNTKPTPNEDIRYSNESKDWNKWVDKSIKSEGTTTKLGDIKLPKKEQKIPIKKQINIPTKDTIDAKKESNVLKVESERIAEMINKDGGLNIKERSWVETSTESPVLYGKVFSDDLDFNRINYTVLSNESSLQTANNKLNRMGYDKALEYVNNLTNNEHLPSASDMALAQRVLQEASKKGDVETVQNLIMDISILGTDLGQATQALSIINKLTPEGQLRMYTKIVDRAKVRGEKSFQNVEITPEMVQNILEAYQEDGTYNQEDLNQRVEVFKRDIAKQLQTTTGEKINSWRYLSMLGNPKTHIRNIVSNIAMRGTIKVKNAMARTIETIAPIKNKTKTWKKASDFVQKFSSETAIDMKDIITGEAKYNEKGALESKKQIFKNKTLEKISNFNSNALESEDWFFSKRAFKDTLQEYLTANGIRTQEDIENHPDIVEKGKQYAVEQAEIATFRQYSALASKINQIERGKGKIAKLAIEATIPFKKTPINVAKAGANYSPVGLIKNVTYDIYQLKQGNIEASQFIDNLSQGLTGTSLMLIGYALAKAGFLKGAGDDDKEAKYDYQLGKQTYAINIGDKSYSISWLSPVAIPLLVGANAFEQLEENKDWNMNIVTETLAKTLDPLNDMSFLSSLTDTLNSYSKGADKIKATGESILQNYVGQFFPTLFSQIASTMDDTKRSTKTSNNSDWKFGEETARKVAYKIPIVRNQLEPATDIWGNEKKQSSNIITRAFESFLAPYSKTEDISTKLDNEIKKVYGETGRNDVIPGVPYAYTRYKGETYRMSAKEYTKFKETYGQTANKTLNELIKTNEYKNASYDTKAKMIKNTYEYSRALANEQYFDKNNVDYSNSTLTKIDSKDMKPSEYISTKRYRGE